MKKQLTVIFAVLLIVSLTCIFTACNVDDLLDDITGGSESLPYSEEQIESKIEALAATGYEITFEYTDESNDSGEYTIGAKGNAAWAIFSDDGDDSGYALKEADDATYFYNYEDGKFVYVNEFTAADEIQIKAFNSGYMLWFNYGQAFDGSLTKLEDTTIAGRSCYQYKYNPIEASGIASKAISAVAGVDMEYKFAIDKELGITMKLSIDFKADGESSSLSYEVKSFKSGDAVVAPELSEPVKFGPLPENVKITTQDNSGETKVLTKIGDRYLFDDNGIYYAYIPVGNDMYKIYNYEGDPTPDWVDYDSIIDGKDILKSTIYFIENAEVNSAEEVDGVFFVNGVETIKYVKETESDKMTYSYAPEYKYLAEVRWEDKAEVLEAEYEKILSWDTTVTTFDIQLPDAE